MQRRGENVDESHTIAEPTVASVRQRPPEEEGRTEEADVLNRMDKFIVESCLV